MGNAQSQVGRRERLGRHEIEVVKYLGEGGSSFIFLVKDVASPSGKLMVLKRLVAENDSAFELIDSEIRMHKRFRNKNMVEFFDSHVVNKRGSEKEVFILMEYCPSGHLYDNMKKMGDKRFTEKDLLKLFHQLCIPVQILHHEDPPIAHRDIKLENFLLAKNGTYKLCDFGSCVDGPQSLKTKSDRARESEHVLKRTTAMYRSPELADIEGTAMFGAGVLTEAVDIWALGCVLYTMAYFKPPFPPEGLRTERYTIPAIPKYSNDFQQLIARMLCADVERRASIDHVLDCIEALLEEKPLPRNASESSASKSSKSTTSESVAKSSASSKSSISTAIKTTEARKETTPAAKPAADLLDFDFNPTISKPAPAAPMAPTFEAFADFANFPTSPIAAPAGSTVPAGKKIDHFGFPVSPTSMAFQSPPQTQPQAQGFGSFPSMQLQQQQQAAASQQQKVDPFSAFDAFSSASPQLNPSYMQQQHGVGSGQQQQGFGGGQQQSFGGQAFGGQQIPYQQQQWGNSNAFGGGRF